jgi:putative phosphoribosyl transferase
MRFPAHNVGRLGIIGIWPAEKVDLCYERALGALDLRSVHGSLLLATEFNSFRPVRIDSDQIGGAALLAYCNQFKETLLMSVSAVTTRRDVERQVVVGSLQLPGNLGVPRAATTLVIFAHGSGSSRFSPRNMAVAEALNAQGMGTLLFDLLTPDEEQDRANVFDIPLLAERLVEVVRWIDRQPELTRLQLGLFGASTGAAAALVAAAELGSRVGAVVSRGGRPDLAGAALKMVTAPTLLIVGGFDGAVIELNEQAFAQLTGKKSLEIIPGASHLFPEPGAMEAVIVLAARWFSTHLSARRRSTSG